MVRPSSLLEIKPCSAYQLDEWLAGVPDGPTPQTQWYLAVTGYGQANVAARLGGNRLVVHRVDVRSRHIRLDDNPSLSAAYIDALRAECVGLWRRRMIEGTWVIAEGAVYDMFDEQRIVVDELPPMRRYWVAIDYGTANQFSAILYGLGANDRLYAVNEWSPNS
ncbi:hypothetical protein OG887_19185 [Streptomyces sp. NBC_00053]|uniref:hypothetical protein n=1 Tax=unclassified Streptomyces TaxID=2593676 RepID=UPI000F94DBB7|nr:MULTISPECIES: hypothetical protein [unclassified Streptomyces]RPK68993.1 Terminase-like family protein [Streptomyces sp. ADI95-17]WSG51749.1 hypothetical protein OHA38_19185 [Streptomyces sp. NBC_01732]WSX02405.1 hypothetical protein OG355_19320 [Streptomyces sp. NBC_00987]MCX5501487.1 hypothetical protein [Streptomyces sp. NBC_00052]MCX5549978.1 hypothetical protein [Streptomyces sp. NBC_00051]